MYICNTVIIHVCVHVCNKDLLTLIFVWEQLSCKIKRKTLANLFIGYPCYISHGVPTDTLTFTSHHTMYDVSMCIFAIYSNSVY